MGLGSLAKTYKVAKTYKGVILIFVSGFLLSSNGNSYVT